MHVMGVIARNQVCEKGKGTGKGKEHSIHVGSGFHENGPWLPVLFVHERLQKNLEYVEWMIKTYLSFKETKQTWIMSSCQWYGIVEIGSCAKDGNTQDLHFSRPYLTWFWYAAVCCLASIGKGKKCKSREQNHNMYDKVTAQRFERPSLKSFPAWLHVSHQWCYTHCLCLLSWSVTLTQKRPLLDSCDSLFTQWE